MATVAKVEFHFPPSIWIKSLQEWLPRAWGACRMLPRMWGTFPKSAPGSAGLPPTFICVRTMMMLKMIDCCLPPIANISTKSGLLRKRDSSARLHLFKKWIASSIALRCQFWSAEVLSVLGVRAAATLWPHSGEHSAKHIPGLIKASLPIRDMGHPISSHWVCPAPPGLLCAPSLFWRDFKDPDNNRAMKAGFSRA